MNNIKLSILDQSIVRKGGTAAEAIQNTIDTVKVAEQLGYHRFWASEHHNSTMIAGSAPEILMARLAGETKKIRIGSGGIMLPNHSAYKVAENFRLLENMYPGRIDLGMGRAPGGDRISSQLLNPSNNFSEADYIKQLQHLKAFFKDKATTQYGPIVAAPHIETVPQQWILCSSGGSASIAAKAGLGLVIAKFINGFASADIIDIYKQDFVPSEFFTEPKVMLAISVQCGETEEKAKELRKLNDYVLLQFEKGNFTPMFSYEDIKDYEFTADELLRINYNSGRIISGTATSVKAQLEKLAAEFEVDEIIISSMSYSQQDRLRGFELLSEAFNLKRN